MCLYQGNMWFQDKVTELEAELEETVVRHEQGKRGTVLHANNNSIQGLARNVISMDYCDETGVAEFHFCNNPLSYNICVSN